MLSERLSVDECLCSQTSLLVRCLLLVCWRIIGCLCLLAGASLAVAGNAECITLETSQDWLRMLVCHTAVYREAVFTVQVASGSVVATLQCSPLLQGTLVPCVDPLQFLSGKFSNH